MPTIAESVKAILEREDRSYVWFGHSDIWHEAYETARGKSLHPMDTWQAVRKALSRSKLFRVENYIRCASWSGREIEGRPGFM